MTSVYKYRSDINRDLLTIANNQIYVPKRVDLNDPIDYAVDDSALKYDTDALKVIDVLKNKIAIFSLSYHFSNIQMWSYYANGHKGMCIQYNYDVLHLHFENSNCFFGGKVLYTKKPFVIDNESYQRLLNGNRQEFTKLTLAKSDYWESEAEFRICFKSDGLVDIPENAVTGIYFGVFMSDEDKNKIMKTLKFRDIKYYQMKLKPSSFELEYEEVINNEK